MGRRKSPWVVIGRLAVCLAAGVAGVLSAQISSVNTPAHASVGPEGVQVGIGDLTVESWEPERMDDSIDGLWAPHDASLADMREGQVITGATPHRLILFTFDDGPNVGSTPRLLNLLDRYGIRAVFFLNGRRISGDRTRHRAQARIARDIVARGHWVGNHTFSHEQLPLVNNERVAFQMDETRRAFEREIGRRAWLFRPPGGARSARVDGLIESRGYTMMMWNLGTGDTQVDDPDAVLETWRRVLERRERENGELGGIILLHDIHQHSVTAFVRIVQDIHRRNCALLPRGEELYDIVDDPRLFFQARRGAAPGTATPPLVLPPEVLEARQARIRIETAVRCARRTAPEGV